MKKFYVKPELQIEELLVEGVLAMSGTDVGDEGVPFTNKKDRQWGRDLWGEKE